MSHTCKALVIHCMDFRIQKDLNDFFTSLGLVGDFDRVSVAGAIRPLVHGTDAEKAYVMSQIATSVRLHATREAYLIAHTDCGAYGGRDAFADAQAEHTTHVADLNTAKSAILAAHPELTVKLIIARLTEADGKLAIDFEQVQ